MNEVSRFIEKFYFFNELITTFRIPHTDYMIVKDFLDYMEREDP